jgi:hypothetical protein
MRSNDSSVTCVAVPDESRVARFYATTNLADAYAIRLPKGAVADPELLARFIFSQQAPWMSGLMRIRDTLVAGLGLKTAKQLQGLAAAHAASDAASVGTSVATAVATSVATSGRDERIGLFKNYEIHKHEIVLGEDDKHLDFRVSVLLQTRTAAAASARYLTVSTVVHCHNRLGRAYIRIIAPFHRLIVQAILRRAARAGWPTSVGDAQAARDPNVVRLNPARRSAQNLSEHAAACTRRSRRPQAASAGTQ